MTRSSWRTDRSAGSSRKVLKALEEARNAKHRETVEAPGEGCSGGSGVFRAGPVSDQLRYLFIVSAVSSYRSVGERNGSVAIQVARRGAKCGRCWNYSIHVGEDEELSHGGVALQRGPEGQWRGK